MSRAPDLVAAVSLDRECSGRAWAVATVRAALDGAYGDGYVRLRSYEAREVVERVLRGREHPDRVDGERELLVE